MTLTKEQLELRRSGLGGSDIGAVAGLNPYKNALDVWRAKVEGFEQPDNPNMKRGRLLERAVLDWYEGEKEFILGYPGTVRHPRVDIALATPDAVCEYTSDKLSIEPVVVEAKTASWRVAHHWGEPGTDQIPESYHAQVTWTMGVVGAKGCDVPVLLAEEFQLYHVDFDPELFGQLLELGKKFWRDHVVTGVPPAIDGSESCAEWLKEKLHQRSEEVLEASGSAEVQRWLERYRQADLVEEQAKNAKREARNHLELAIGEFAGLRCGDARISWRQSKNTAKTDWEAVAKEANVSPVLVEKHTIIKPGPRVFRLTSKK